MEMQTYIKLAETHMWSEGLMARIYVNRSPDLRLGMGEVKRLMGFVMELEGTPYSIGPNSTSLWLRDYVNYWQYFPQDYSRSADLCPSSFLPSNLAHVGIDVEVVRGPPGLCQDRLQLQVEKLHPVGPGRPRWIPRPPPLLLHHWYRLGPSPLLSRLK